VSAVIEEASMGIISEFKEFVSRGNVVDLAVGVVIGASFGKIVSSLVDGLVMPTVGLLTGGVKFSDLAVTLREAQIDAAGKEIAPALLLKYGAFLQTLIDFLLIALVIFLFLKAYNRVRTPAPAAATPEDVLLLREIRDSLKK
jgi:large conductance mechanosensitive channel